MTDPHKAYEQSRALEPDEADRPDEAAGADQATGADQAARHDQATGADQAAWADTPTDAGRAPTDEAGRGGTDAGVPRPGGEQVDETQPPTFTDPTAWDVTDASPTGSTRAVGDDALRAAEAVRGPAHDAEALRTALTEAERQRDEYLDHLRRERAEFDNFRKRNARERLEAMDRGVQSLMTELLGVLDNFKHVLAAAEDSEDQALAKGAAMVHDELVGVLGRFGLEEVPGEGSVFDPQWHEAMMQVAAEEEFEEPTVAQVLRSGYRFKGRVLRPASVSVAQ